MQSAHRSTTTVTQNKLLLLYALTKLGPITGEQALRFVVEVGLMGYLDFALSLAELAEARLLLALEGEFGRTYHITRQGEETLDFFQKHAPYSKIVLIDEACPDWKQTFRRESQYRTEITPSPSGFYAVRLSARSPDEPLADVTLYVSRHQHAEAIAAAWPKHADALYKTLLDTLLSLGEPMG